MKRFSTLLAVIISLCGLALSSVFFAREQAVRVEIVAPMEGHRLMAESVVEVDVLLSDGEELAGVEVLLDGASLGVKSDPPFRFPVGRLIPSSVHRIRAVAITRSGRRAIDTLVLSGNEDKGFAVRVDLVTLYVSVTDATGNHVRGLSKEDFAVDEEGTAQEITFYASEATPLTLALLMDVSSSMIGERIVRSQAAAVDLINTLIKKGDQAMVLGFDHRLLMYQPLTGDVGALEDAVRMTGPNGGTALYDALAGTVRKLFTLRGKRAIIVLSDGDDTDSEFHFDDVLDYLQKAGVIVYSVGLQTLTVAQTRANQTRETIRQLRSLAEITGGQAYFPSFISHLPGIYAAIGQDLSSKYTVAYYPSNKVRDGRWRGITVRVKGRPGLAVRHRKGYYAIP